MTYKRLITSCLLFVATFSLLLAYSAVAAAAPVKCDPNKPQTDVFACACQETTATSNSVACKTDGSDPVNGSSGILSKVRILISFVGGVAAVVIILFSGLRFITANGDAQKVASARTTILYTLIGVVILVMANAIIVFVVKGL